MRNVTYISAGAGSGKTHKLTEILHAKLCKTKDGKDPEVNPSQVILTTFTELAAAELREKVRATLIKEDAGAATDIESAAIGTVHSIAFRFIRKFWYLLGYGAEIQPISERDEDFYMRESLTRIVSERGEDGKILRQFDLDNFHRFRDYYDISDSFGHPDDSFWQEILKSIVEKMEYYGVDDLSVSVEKSIETLRSVYCKAPVNYSFLEMALAEYGDFCAGKTKENGDTADRGKRGADRLLAVHRKGRRWLQDVQSFMKNPCSRVTAGKVCPHFTEFINALDEAEISSTHLEVLEPFVRSVFSLAKVWRDDCREYKRKNHIVSYNDMEQLFLQLLTDHKEVQDYVRNNYRLVMVDEFQDSNPIQLKIFNRLSELVAAEGGHSYWVGDPKQAIYAFRGADSDLIASVSGHFKFDDVLVHPEEGENHLGSERLDKSWRSRKQLVELVNDVFRDKFAGEIDRRCITLNANFTDDELTSKPVCHLNYVTDNNRLKTPDPAAIAAKVKELLDSGMMVHRGRRDEPSTVISPRDIAVLCRRKETVSNVVKAMRKRGIPVSQSESDIMQRVEVALVVTLLRFIQNPKDGHAKADLRRMLLGESTRDILMDRISFVSEHADAVTGKIEDESWCDGDGMFSALKRITESLKNLPIPEMVRGLIYECDLPALCGRWGEENVRRQNLSTLQHLADDYDGMCVQRGFGSSISGFINFLETVEPDPEKDNKSDTVKVFTYHGSKGLEWPVVIMNELNYNALDQSDFIKKSFMRVNEVVLKDNASAEDPFAKEYCLHYFPYTVKVKGGNTKPAQSMMDIVVNLEIFRNLNMRVAREEKRLLYVGMTRAKDCLYSVGLRDSFSWLKNVGISGSSKDNVWGVSGYSNECEDITTPEDGKLHLEKTFKMILKPETRTAFEPRFLSPSKLESFEGYNTHNAWKDRGTEMDHRGWGNDYAAIGSCIHDIFAVFKAGDDKENRRHALNIIGGYGLADKLAGHIDGIIASAGWLYERLQAAFPQQPGDRTDREYPFMHSLPSGKVLRGEMDLLWHYSDGQGSHCVLVDYKTFPGVDLHEHTKKYYAQLSAYAQALKDAGTDVSHALIYYPVHGIIHELVKE